jgi:hypothetical protein
MLGRNASEPMLFQMVDLEALVPATHRLRKIDRVRGCRRLQVQADLVATVQNLKRLASFRGRKPRGAAQAALPPGISDNVLGSLGRSPYSRAASHCRRSTVQPLVPRRCHTHPFGNRHYSTDF